MNSVFQQAQGYGGYDQSQYSQQGQGSNGAAQNTSYGGQQSYDQSSYGQQGTLEKMTCLQNVNWELQHLVNWLHT